MAEYLVTKRVGDVQLYVDTVDGKNIPDALQALEKITEINDGDEFEVYRVAQHKSIKISRRVVTSYE